MSIEQLSRPLSRSAFSRSGLSRRSLIAGGLGGVAGLTGLTLLSACGSDDGPVNGSAGSGPTVKIEHLFGSTTLKGRPSRVVALGGGDMQAAIALGVIPVGGADWFGYDTMRTWVADAIGDRKPPELLPADPVNAEKVAALRPDLILYVNSTNEESTYKTLAKIAPTIAAPKGVTNSYGVAWQNQLDVIARALGRTPQGAAVRSRTQAAISKAREAHPEFAGATVTAGVYSPGAMSVWLPSDPRMRLLTQLGFKLNDKISALDKGDFFVELSPERLDLMEADLIFLAALGPDGKVDSDLESNGPFQALATVRAGHTAYFPGPGTIMSTTDAGNFSSAFSIGGPIGIPACIDELCAKLSAGLRGA